MATVKTVQVGQLGDGSPIYEARIGTKKYAFGRHGDGMMYFKNRQWLGNAGFSTARQNEYENAPDQDIITGLALESTGFDTYANTPYYRTGAAKFPAVKTFGTLGGNTLLNPNFSIANGWAAGFPAESEMLTVIDGVVQTSASTTTTTTTTTAGGTTDVVKTPTASAPTIGDQIATFAKTYWYWLVILLILIILFWDKIKAAFGGKKKRYR